MRACSFDCPRGRFPVVVLPGGTLFAQKVATDELLSAVVQVKTFINPDGRTVEILGREREGSGIVIDDRALSSLSAT